MEPGHDQLGLPTARDEPDLDAVVVAEDQEERHHPARHVGPVTVQAGIVDVRRLKARPGDLALGVLPGLMEGLHLVYKS